MAPDLVFTFDAEHRPIAAKCARCGEVLPAPPPNVLSSVETVMWFSRRFQEHLQQKHITSSQ